MCGDGANDAPALRQAQIGIAVSTATDVAKSAAGVVLTEAGLGGIVAAVKEGRVTFQRILTYTLNSVMKKFLQVLLLTVGLIMTGHAVLTPMLMVIVMITGDFLAMSLTTDRVRPSKMPNSWHIGRITAAGIILGVCFLAFSTAILAVGKFQLHLSIEALQTLSVVAIVFGSQATTYVIRGRQHLWGLRPSVWLVLSSVADVLIISTLAILGIAMAPLPIRDHCCRVWRCTCIRRSRRSGQDPGLCPSPYLLTIQMLVTTRVRKMNIDSKDSVCRQTKRSTSANGRRLSSPMPSRRSSIRSFSTNTLRS